MGGNMALVHRARRKAQGDRKRRRPLVATGAVLVAADLTLAAVEVATVTVVEMVAAVVMALAVDDLNCLR